MRLKVFEQLIPGRSSEQETLYKKPSSHCRISEQSCLCLIRVLATCRQPTDLPNPPQNRGIKVSKSPVIFTDDLCADRQTGGKETRSEYSTQTEHHRCADIWTDCAINDDGAEFRVHQ